MSLRASGRDLLVEEHAYAATDGFVAGQRIAADLAVPEAIALKIPAVSVSSGVPRTPGFHIADEFATAATSRVRSRGVMVVLEVLPIGGVDEIHVVARGIVALADDLIHRLKRMMRPCRRAPDLEKFALLEFTGLDRVRHEDSSRACVLAAQAFHHPEEECLGELAIPVAQLRRTSMARTHRLGGRRTARDELTEAQISSVNNGPVGSTTRA